MKILKYILKAHNSRKDYRLLDITKCTHTQYHRITKLLKMDNVDTLNKATYISVSVL